MPEGSSLSARQTITALGMAGYRVDICSSDRFCIGAFSRFVRKVHILPPAAAGPKAYLDNILRLLQQHGYDVLLPTHEQAFLFAAAQNEVRRHTHMAIAPFESFLQVQGKTASARLFEQLGLPQPAYTVVSRSEQDISWNIFPAYAKLAYGTAGQNVWRVDNVAALERLLRHINWEAPNELLLQAQASGAYLCQAQAMFSEGALVALHCTQQYAAGIGNSQSARLSVDHPTVAEHMKRLGSTLHWHGPITVDYLYDERSGPQYIEVNPRLVEPMNGVFAGVNMAALAVELSLHGVLALQNDSKAGVLSSSLLATLLGAADRSRSRAQVTKTILEAVTRSGVFQNSREDLTPLFDFPSLIPLSVVFFQLLARPSSAQKIASKSINQYALPASAIKSAMSWNVKSSED